MKKIFIASFTLATLWGMSITRAWVYPEHRDIFLLAIQNLSTDYRSTLDALWAEARIGYEFRLTESVIDATQTTMPTHLDYASFPAIGGDHSTSAKNMLDIILQSEWIMDVADITARLKIDLQNSTDRNMRVNALRNSDIRLQTSDPDYATRAGHNHVHFLLSLENASESREEYAYECIKEGSQLNALGVYLWYHNLALKKMNKLSSQKLSQTERSALILAALADEGFGLHFLEDVFAAGHAAGTWGDASQQKGTHDFYNEHGLKTTTWSGKNIVLTGDAWMRDEDAEFAANVIRLSLEQLLDASRGKINVKLYDDELLKSEPEDFDISKNEFMPSQKYDNKFVEMLNPILYDTPIPGLIQGLGELPRFRAELGTFFGFSPSLRGAVINGGFGLNQKSLGVIGGLEGSIRFGLGLDGILNEASDGLVFLDVGWRQDGSSSVGIIAEQGTENYGALLSAIPGRSAFSARIRLPFYIIPGDLLIAAPIMLLLSPKDFSEMAVTAVNGGLIPWHLGMATPIGRFQIVLGREAAIYLFGRTKQRDALLVFDENGDLFICSYRSTQIEFPFLEYRPLRSFSTDQSSTLLVQLYGGVDIPHNIESLDPTYNRTPKLENVWYLGVRFVFDWRHYL
ncbi:MAG: hypothetical protein KBF59_07320 [Ignavibacterium sp.]|nr:hypothetical protein [Ignavibacterium sp.]